MQRYILTWSVTLGGGTGEYQIIDRGPDGAAEGEGTVVFTRPDIPGEDTGEYDCPEDVRKKYEELIGKPEFGENLVPPYLSQEEAREAVRESVCAWAQHLRFGGLYCGHTGWLYAPRKCRRGIENGEGMPSQETCPGFKLNSNQAKH